MTRIFYIMIGLLILNIHPSHSSAYTDPRVTQLSGIDRYATAAVVAQSGWTTSETVVLARGDDFPDALAGAPFAAHLGAPILLTRTNEIPDMTKSELTRLQAKNVFLLGGEGAISAEVEQELQDLNLNVERISGSNRFETSYAIAKRMNPSLDNVILTAGYNFPDALAAGPYAAEKGIPILLSTYSELPSFLADYASQFTKAYIIGGEAIISKKVEDQVQQPTRIFGKTRYETNAKIIENFYSGVETVYLSTGLNFPDALTGSVLAAKNKSPILLVHPKEFLPDYEPVLEKSNIQSLKVLGGTGVVPEKMIKNIKAISFSKGCYCQISDVKDIQPSSVYSLALKNDGTVWRWGNGIRVPVQVEGLTNVVAISAGSAHSLALKNDGTVWAWGDNSKGQLGDPAATTIRDTPLQVPGLPKLKEISAGRAHNLALTEDGTVYSWGANANGQLGLGTTQDSYFPYKIPTLADVVKISAGGSHNLVLLKNGTLMSWGSNSSNQSRSGPIPKAIYVNRGYYSGSALYTDISAVQSASMVRDDKGDVWAWGYNWYDQLGLSRNYSTSTDKSMLSGSITYSLGHSYSLMTDKDGIIWGIGLGITQWGAPPVMERVSGKRDVISVHANRFYTMTNDYPSHSFAIQKDGRVWAFGTTNSSGQLGCEPE
jgi:alpha-tubulin suppressor-like RCC1 family protein/putative cell wall-binding protein